MPYKVLESRYQLQAQKRHEDFLKQDYYRRTARYFERETTSAKQFNSWINRSPKLNTDMLEKTHRIEKLQSRRERLRQLLIEENKLYKRELEQQKKTKKRKDNHLSLEILRQKLLEKKAEENLYYPSTCRKLRSNIVNPNDINKVEFLDIRKGYNTSKPVTRNRQNQVYSINPYLERTLFQSIDKNSIPNIQFSKEYNESLNMSKTSDKTHQKMRFAINNIQQSLQDTNIRSTDIVDHSDIICTLKKESPTTLLNKQQNMSKYINSENLICKINSIDDRSQQSELYCNQEYDTGNNQKKLSFEATESSSIPSHLYDESALQFEVQHKKSDILDEFIPKNDNIQLDEKTSSNFNCHRRGNMQQKETDCAGNADISVQMFRYLQHNDLKRKILDLCKREHIFTIKQCWNDALRLREMRNQLILLKNKNLYENQDLQIDDETRQFGLSLIETRETLNKKRVKMCNSMLYSDEAKALWKQWNTEDDEISKTEMNTVRDVLLNELESEWKNLALRDKNRISQLYDRVMTKSDLQDEHKLAAVIQDANIRQKQYMNYLAI